MDKASAESELHRIQSIIAAGQYHRAHHLLLRLDHPDAHQLLAEVDALIQQEQAGSGRFQFMPRFTIFLTMFFLLWGLWLVWLQNREEIDLWTALCGIAPLGYLVYLVAVLPPLFQVLFMAALGFTLSLILSRLSRSKLAMAAVISVFFLNWCGYLHRVLPRVFD